MAYRYILYEVDGPVAKVTLNRPERKNAQSRGLLDEMDHAFRVACDDDNVRVIVLAGKGETFSAGHDLGSPEQRAEEAERPRTRYPGLAGRFDRIYDMYIDMGLRWRNLPKPTIAMVQGYCIFGGWMIATAMDLIVAADNAKFLGSHFQYFSIPYDVSPRKAKELLFEFRFMHADEAEKAGLVNKVVPLADLESETMAMAHRIAQNDSFALRMAKFSVNQAQDIMGYTTFVRGAVQTYHVATESGAKELTEGKEGGRRVYNTVERARAYEAERENSKRRT